MAKSAKSLIIVESPAKIKTLQKLLGPDYAFESSYGHVRDLPEKEFGIDFDTYFAPELQRIETPRDDGLLVISNDEIRATWLGRIFIRNLAMVFDPYLEKQHLDAKPLFSKTL